MQEVLVDLLAAPTVVHSFAGVDMPRLGDSYPFGIYRCADGYLGVNILTQGHWTALCQLMDRPDLVDHPRYRTGVERADPAVAAELDAIITGWAATQPAGRRSAPVRRSAARSRSCPARPRSWRRSSTRPATSGWTSTTPSSARCGCPGSRSAWRRGRSPRPPRRRGGDVSPLPLQGVRVLDLTAWQAGPVCAMTSATTAPTSSSSRPRSASTAGAVPPG